MICLCRALPVVALCLVTACEPLSCQGRVTDNLQAVAVQDVPPLAPRCPDGDFEGDVDITTRAELDTLAGCNTIRGSVIVHDSDDIVDLSVLAELQRLENGYLLVLGNTALTSIQLPALANLENGLTALDNPVLTEVVMPQLSNLEGDLTLRNNARLSKLTFPRVAHVKDAVANVGGAQVAVSVGNVILGELPALTSLQDAFPVLSEIDGSLEIFATGLRNFAGLETLQKIRNTGGAATARTKFRVDKLNPGFAVGIDFDDAFDIAPAGNPNLESFQGLQNLSEIAGDIVVAFNPALRDLRGLDGITRIENGAAAASVYVFENDALESLLGLDGDANGDGDDDGLDTITGSLFVGLYFDRFGQPKAGGNDRLANLDGLDQLVAIEARAPGAGLPRGLVLGFNDALENLQGLGSLVTLNGDLQLVGSQRLQSLSGASSLQTVNGNLVLGQLLRRDGKPFDPDENVEDQQLKDIGFPAASDGVLRPQVRDPAVRLDTNGGLGGFDVLTTVTGDLVVAFSGVTDLTLTNPAGGALTTVNGRVILYGNDAPGSLQGLQTVTTLGGLVVNFAVDAFDELVPFPNGSFASFDGLDVTALGDGGLHIGFDGNLGDAALATLPSFTSVAGSVTLASVDGRGDVGPTSLAALDIATIGGDLVVCAVNNGDAAPVAADLDNLRSLALDGVNRVDGDVLVAFCSNLIDASAGISEVRGTLELTSLPSLESVAGLAQLTRAGSLLLHDLSDVVTVTLPNLAQVTGNVELVGNPSLSSFNLGVVQVGGTLRLVDLRELADVEGLADLRTVVGDVDLVDCPALQDTAGLGNLTTVGGDLRLRRLDNVTNQARADGLRSLNFASLVQVGGLEVSSMGNLEDLAGLETLQRIGFDEAGALSGGGVLTIARNPKLETLFGLQGLTRVGRKIAILDNEQLVDFSFDDDDGNRVPDTDDGDGVVGPPDPDDVFEAGFTASFTVLGSPQRIDGVVIGGSNGVVELKNNPQLNESAFRAVVVENLDGFEGSLVFCGNNGSQNDVDDDPGTVFSVECPQGQDGTSGLF